MADISTKCGNKLGKYAFSVPHAIRAVIINFVTLILSNLSLVTSLRLQWMGHFIRSKSDEK